MKTNRTDFIQSLFNFLSRRDYLWLKATLEQPEETAVTSDIDLFIKQEDLPDVLLFISRQPDVEDCQVEEKGKAVFLQLFFTDGSHLKVDLLTQLVRKQWTYLTEQYLFKNRIWNNNIATYTHDVLLEHVLYYNFLNYSGLSQKYIQYFEQMPEAEQARLLRFLREKYGLAYSSFATMATFDASVRKQLIRFLERQPENNLPGRIKRGLQYFTRHLRWNRRKGKIVTFSGVDGAGKTTLLNDLKTVLTEQLHEKVVVLRHRPSLLPILSAWTQGREAAEQKAARSLPRQGLNRSWPGSLARFSYYYTDYLFGQCYVWFRYLLPGYTVIYDRYYFDFIVDGKRSNISLGERLPRCLYRFVAKPGLNVFLYADPSVIRQRKQELPADDIALMTGRYMALFGEFANCYQGQYLCIENTDRTNTLLTVLKHYYKTF